MLKSSFDPKKRHPAVTYLRMSDKQQNPRSPDQQLAEINRVMKACGLDWPILKNYRDEAKTARLHRNRPDYQQMMRDVKTGIVPADLILVDTLERFGRVDDLPGIRKDLAERHGVLVLTADSNFCDPGTVQGRALGTVEAIRASEDSPRESTQRAERQTRCSSVGALARWKPAIRLYVEEHPEN